jgi:hypothetical protein
MNKLPRKGFTFAALAAVMAVASSTGVSDAAPTARSNVRAVNCEAVHVIGVHGLNEDPLASNRYMGPNLGGPGGFWEKISAGSSAGAYVPHGVKYKKTTDKIWDEDSLLLIASRVNEGAKLLDSMVNKIVDDMASAGCTDDQGDIVVAGYSQGAWVADRFVQQYASDARNLEAVVMFGDPAYKPCVSVIRNGDCIGTQGVPDIMRDESGKYLKTSGIVRQPPFGAWAQSAAVPRYLPVPDSHPTEETADELWRNTRSYCIQETDPSGLVTLAYDPICAWNGLGAKDKYLKVHTKGYRDKGIYDEAVTFLRSIL